MILIAHGKQAIKMIGGVRISLTGLWVSEGTEGNFGEGQHLVVRDSIVIGSPA